FGPEPPSSPRAAAAAPGRSVLCRGVADREHTGSMPYGETANSVYEHRHGRLAPSAAAHVPRGPFVPRRRLLYR
ncbi:MAG: hypothetical protein D6760_13190, partial [Deltaproteobacteria bacterium]